MQMPKEDSSSPVSSIAEYSRYMDNHQGELRGLPTPSDWELMVGQNPLWQKIQEGEATDDELDLAINTINKYPRHELPHMREGYEEQKKIALMLDVVDFWKPHWRFADDLVKTVLSGKLLTVKQEKWLRYYAYKYRNQIIEKVINERQAREEFYNMVDNVRHEVVGLLERCESEYEEMDDVDN